MDAPATPAAPQAPKRRWRVDGLLVVLVLVVGWLALTPGARISDEDRPAPPLKLTLLDGRPVDLADLRGKVVLVNYWATWCGYCRRENPDLERYWTENRGRGFEFLSLSIDENEFALRQYVADRGHTMPIARADAAAAQAFGTVSGVPLSFLIDRNGVVRKRISGGMGYEELARLAAPFY